MPELPFWREGKGSCNAIRGTDGSVFHPGIAKSETLYVFSRDLCRSLPLVFKEEVTMNGIPGYRFVPRWDAFADARENPDNLCFCAEGSQPGQPGCSSPSGVFNMSACQYDSPVMLSWPHFFQADPQLLTTVEGLEPKEADHQFFLDIQPRLGTGLRAKARTQINVAVDPAEGVKAAEGLPRMILPVLWFSDGVDGIENEETLALLRSAVLAPEVARTVMYPSLFALGVLILLAAATMYAAGGNQKRVAAAVEEGEEEEIKEKFAKEEEAEVGK